MTNVTARHNADLATGGVMALARGRRSLNWFAPALAALVLVLMWRWEASSMDANAGADYRARVRALVDQFNAQEVVGEWKGMKVPMPPEAIAALGVNSVVSQAYYNLKKPGQAVEVLFIQVEDSRDMMGHYPPNCYPGNGWVEQPELRQVRDGAAGHMPAWAVDGLTIPGVEYTFKRTYDGQEQMKVVRNFFVLPSGQYFPEMDSFWRPAMSFANRPFGAAQMQVIWDREYLPEDRDEMFASIIHAHRVLIDAVSRKN